MRRLTFEEFAWAVLWLEWARLREHIAPSYATAGLHKLMGRARRGELWQGPYFDRSEWAGMVRRWYADYLRTGEL